MNMGRPWRSQVGWLGVRTGASPRFRRGVADALAEAGWTELVGATKEFDGIVGIVGS